MKKWINIQDQQPDLNLMVLIFCPGGLITSGFLMHNYKGPAPIWLDYNEEYELKPTHWMPLPKEPDAIEEEANQILKEMNQKMIDSLTSDFNRKEPPK